MKKLSMTSVVFIAALLSAASHAGTQAPAELAGAWDVEHVAVDEQDQMHWGMRPDDPHLIGRELVIQDGIIYLPGHSEPCNQSAWKAQTLPWRALFAKTFSRAPGGGRSTKPSPADFGLKVQPSAQVSFYQVCPIPDISPRDAWQQQRWVAQQDSDILLMHYSNQVLLTLRRRPRGGKPRASYDCEKAATSTEKTICGSFKLAGWDRSVAKAFKEALELSPEKERTLREEQKAWLKKRDACGANVECVYEQLWQRVDELSGA
jgi:uncharacterized protein YecT (DUF1311 family)